MQDLGMPDVGAVRFAITNPDLVNSKALSVGYRMSQPDLLSGMINGLTFKLCGAIGVMIKTSLPGMIIGPEQLKLYPVEPVGVDIIKPSAQ